MRIVACLAGVWMIFPTIVVAQTPIIIDHACIDFDSIPLDVIEQVKSPDNVFHYAHRSHGWQPVEGLIQIESMWGSTYNFDREYCGMPDDTTALGMWDGMTQNDYAAPEDYWFSEDGMNDVRSILTNNPEIKYSMWSWCGEHTWWPLEDIQAYLDSLDQLSTEFENVTFVYMTGHAEYYENDPWGMLMRWERGNMIRDYCIENNKVLFDFEDMDCWCDGEQYLVTLELDSTYVIPAQHPNYWGDEIAHTTYDNCLNKGKAFWYMMAFFQDMLTAPSIRAITAYNDSIRIYWAPIAGSDGYNVYSSENPYYGFQLDLSGVFYALSWASEMITDKKYYEITSTLGAEESPASERIGYSDYQIAITPQAD